MEMKWALTQLVLGKIMDGIVVLMKVLEGLIVEECLHGRVEPVLGVERVLRAHSRRLVDDPRQVDASALRVPEQVNFLAERHPLC